MKTSHSKCRRSEKPYEKVIIFEDTFESTDPIDYLDVADGRTSTPIGSVVSPSGHAPDPIKLNFERRVKSNSIVDNRKSSRSCNLAKKSCKKPGGVSSKRFPYLVTQKRVKKQTGFRRRSGRASIRAESPNDEDLKRTKIMRICRKKKG